ncbi:MAG TPA: DUF1592 domain-containing protein, partial [Pirellulaceae bacterium]|nr:DUF1592 domain-containing protein [Pirellulaceae bacterium]
MRHCAVLGITALGLSLFTAAQAIAEEAPNFEQTGFAFVQKHCVSCHGMQEQNAELALHGFRSAKSVIESRKVWTNVLKMVEAGEMPPEDQPQPTVEEAAAFVKAVRDVFDYADRNAKPDAGRVTMRRLNRTEYRNTIRDLVGVDFDPTEDFPADDIGHGFDNIGDVLTLSPVLMERYLTASENIVAQAIVPNPPPMPKRHLSTRYSEPASANVPMEGNFRRLATDGESPVFTGPINTSYKWDNDGEYVFRVRVYAQTAGDKPVIAALLVHGAKLPAPASDDEASKLAGSVIRPVTFLKTFEVKANKPENAEVVEVAVPVIAGRERLAIGLLKPVDGQPPAKLFVEYLALDGPLDTRPASHRRLLACNQEKPQAEQTREILTRFARRAFRRPSTTDEVERLAKLVEASTTSGASWEASMQLALQAILCSPKFLFRMELDDPSQKAAMQPLNEFQLASRMSYFLWSSQPDDELLALAEANQLSANIDAQVRRMLQDPKASSLVQNFAMQWLQIQRLSTFAPDNKLFPQFNEQLRTAMLQETELFFASIMQENRSVIELLDADYTFLNEPLARHYGIADTNGNWMGQKPERPAGQPIRGEQMVRVTLQGRSRGGLLTQASVLTVTSNPTRTSPVKRGRWVLEQLLGAPPPPPPPNVPELPADEQAAAGASLRQRMEAHRKNASCAGCHAKMDPLGFALENYSAIGGFRTKDGTFDIDPTGELPGGRKLQGAEDLKSVLKEQHVQFVRCLTEKMLVYALGRGLEHY